MSGENHKILYLVGPGASKTGVRLSETCMFDNLVDVTKHIIQIIEKNYSNFSRKRNGTASIEELIKYSYIKVYLSEANSHKPLNRRIEGSKVFELINENEEAKRELLKAKLKFG